jgi:SAM-dependent methyltransferase
MATTEQQPALNEEKLMGFVFRAVEEVGATLNAALVVMGDKLGLYQALVDHGPLTAGELADRSGATERYVREWANGQAAGGFVEYDPESGRYSLLPEQAVALTDSSSPAFLPGFFQFALGTVSDSQRITEALPSLDGVLGKLESGARVADVGCGHGSSTILMAEAFPKSKFVGTDYYQDAIDTARERAVEAGIGDNVSFEVADAAEHPGEGYDLVTMFDCLHDMGDPVGAAKQVRDVIAPDGTWMIVEPMAGDRIEDNLNPVGRVAVPGRRAGAGRPGRRGAHPRRGRGRRLHPLPAGRRDPVQHRLRSPSVEIR